MTVSTTHIATKNASQFVEWFTTEWRQDIQRTSLDKNRVMAPSELGMAEMSAEGNELEVTITAPSRTNAAYLEAAVSEFLDRIAGDEELHYQWMIQPEIPERHNAEITRGKFNWSELVSAQG